MSLDTFNSLPANVAIEKLISLCHSAQWAEKIAANRPYADVNQCLEAAEHYFATLPDAQIYWAINSHPRIGYETDNSLSAAEQSSLQLNSDQIQQLHKANKDYANIFGFTYLVFATGRTGSELLEILTTRLNNTPCDELAIAKNELIKITRHRLAGFLAAEDFPLSISTHILDTVQGTPAVGVKVVLYSPYLECKYVQFTNNDGRIPTFGNVVAPKNSTFTMNFMIENHFASDASGAESVASTGIIPSIGNTINVVGSFYPHVSVNFRVADPAKHVHIPLLISPYSYTTYRGS